MALEEIASERILIEGSTVGGVARKLIKQLAGKEEITHIAYTYSPKKNRYIEPKRVKANKDSLTKIFKEYATWGYYEADWLGNEVRKPLEMMAVSDGRRCGDVYSTEMVELAYDRREHGDYRDAITNKRIFNWVLNFFPSRFPWKWLTTIANEKKQEAEEIIKSNEKKPPFYLVVNKIPERKDHFSCYNFK